MKIQVVPPVPELHVVVVTDKRLFEAGWGWHLKNEHHPPVDQLYLKDTYELYRRFSRRHDDDPEKIFAFTSMEHAQAYVDRIDSYLKELDSDCPNCGASRQSLKCDECGMETLE